MSTRPWTLEARMEELIDLAWSRRRRLSAKMLGEMWLIDARSVESGRPL